MAKVKFFSVKRKVSVEVDASQVKLVTLKNGRPAAEATDPVSGTKMFKILSKAEYEALTKK